MSSKRLRNTDLQKHANIFPKQKFIVEARLGYTFMGSVLIGSVLLGNTSKYNKLLKSLNSKSLCFMKKNSYVKLYLISSDWQNVRM